MFSSNQRKFAQTISEIINCNPFLPDRIQLERKALGSEFVEENANWNLHPSQHQATVNLERMRVLAEGILTSCRDADAQHFNDKNIPLYLDLVRFVLFNAHSDAFTLVVEEHGKGSNALYKRFRKDWLNYCDPERFPAAVTEQVPHIFSLLFQIRRAFNNIFRHLIGSSDAIIALRANVWRSIFTHDVRRYYDSMHNAMADFPTLITGPTGSGKELVARAIGLSGYVPFDPETGKWATPLDGLFISLNLSALSPTLIESELFGHAKGAFTGACEDRTGWLQVCPSHGAVFLDEIGELDPGIQVKLLRVVQDRIFQRLGDTQPRQFQGRIIAATNRDLMVEIREERFRLDFYYRLCADQVTTPSLAERCKTDIEELPHLVAHLLARIIHDADHKKLTQECCEWIQQHLGANYAWPGNVRELDQCIRSWLIRQDYRPFSLESAGDDSALANALHDAELSADELTTLYCQVKYAQSGSYVKTAEQLSLDRRTVKARVCPEG